MVHNNQISLKDIAFNTSVPYHTVRKIKNVAVNEGIGGLENLMKKNVKHIRPIAAEMSKAIKSVISISRGQITVEDLQTRLILIDPNFSKVSKSTIYNHLTKVLQAKYIKTQVWARRKFDEANILKRHEVSIKLAQYINAGIPVYSIDETGFSNRQDYMKCWSIPGHHYDLTKRSKNNVTVSCVGLISQFGDIGLKFIKGTTNSAIFSSFLQEYFQNHNVRKGLVLIDNASIHHTREVQATVRGFNLETCFLPPYCPELQPIELFFGSIKRHRSDLDQANIDRLCRKVVSLVSDLSLEHIQGMYRKVLRVNTKYVETSYLQ